MQYNENVKSLWQQHNAERRYIVVNHLSWLVQKTETKWWHDSAIPEQIDAAFAMGALGITTNPVLTYKILQERTELRLSPAL